jgi:hypothetical protein
MKRIKVTIRTNKVGSECSDIMEFEDDDWNSMTDPEREEVCKDAAFNMMEWNFEEMEAK